MQVLPVAAGERSAGSRSLYWHGVGRGIYFDSREMAPVVAGRWRAVEHALETPPGEEARRNAVGDGPLLRAFRGHRVAADPGGLWQSQVLAAVELAIDRVYPLLVEHGRIDELFRYLPVDRWVESLGENAGSRTAWPMELPAHG